VVGTAPLDARLADEAPRLLSHPPLRYPEVMRQAGVEGRVVVEAVLDTTGRVERGSLRIVAGVHELFDAAARDVVAASRYQPARLGARAGRRRLQVPVPVTQQPVSRARPTP
jgi:TonB family protein